MKALLITGSNGWLGKAALKEVLKSQLIKELNTIFMVNLCQTLPDNIDKEIEKSCIKNKTELINLYGNLGENKIFKDIDSNLKSFFISDLKVIAIASIIHPKDYKDFHRVNIYGIKQLYELCSKHRLSKFTYISSNSPFGFNSRKKAFNESSFYSPKGGYGKSKMEAEKFLLSQIYRDKIKIIRAPWFHGKNMPERQKKFLKSASNGKFPLIAFGNNIRSIVDVGDLAKAIMNLTFKSSKHQIYWVSSENIKMKTMISIIKKAAEEKGFIKKRSKFNIVLPIGFSSILFIFDIFLQKCKIYNMYVHVLSEIGQDIFNTNERYKKEFGKYHTFKQFKDTIYEELDEAYFKK